MSAIMTAKAARDMPAGTVIQTKYVEERTEPFTEIQLLPPFTASQGVLLFSAAFTPLLSNSKVLIRGSGGVNTFMSPAPLIVTGAAIIFFAGSTFIAAAYPATYAAGEWVKWALQIMHTPGAGTTTYTVRYGCLNYPGKSVSVYINGYSFGNTAYNPVTSFTLEEIKQ